VTNFNGTTNKSGIFSYSWKIGKEYKSGTFTISVHGSANGYQNQLTPTTMTFDVSSAAGHKTSSKGSHTVHSSASGKSNHPVHSSASGKSNHPVHSSASGKSNHPVHSSASGSS